MDQSIAEQDALGFVHAEVYCQNLFDAPIGHRIGNEDRAGRNFVPPPPLSLQRHLHLSARDPVRRFEGAFNYIARRVRLQALRSVIRLFRPLFLNELDATSIDKHYVPFTYANDD
jgi:hypothetical protein